MKQSQSASLSLQDGATYMRLWNAARANQAFMGFNGMNAYARQKSGLYTGRQKHK